MGDDKNTTALMGQLDNTLSRLWNASVDMDKVAEDCKVTKGEALVDRILKCEEAMKTWDKSLKALDWDLAALKKLYSAFPNKAHGSIASIAEGVFTNTTQSANDMKAKQAEYARQLEAHKQSLRKIKA